jgi:hypothetical protein
MSTELREEALEPVSPRQLAAARYRVLHRLVPVVWLVALWVPIHAVYPIAHVLAGKHTDVGVTISVSIVVSLALGSGYGALVRRHRLQSAEVIRLRERCSRLEGEIATQNS